MEINNVANALIAIEHHLANNGYALSVTSVGSEVTQVVLTGPPGFKAAVVGAEISNALCSVGLPLMGHDFECEFHWPANAQGIVLSINAVG